jgi:hypothetical protein
MVGQRTAQQFLTILDETDQKLREISGGIYLRDHNRDNHNNQNHRYSSTPQHVDRIVQMMGKNSSSKHFRDGQFDAQFHSHPTSVEYGNVPSPMDIMLTLNESHPALNFILSRSGVIALRRSPQQQYLSRHSSTKLWRLFNAALCATIAFLFRYLLCRVDDDGDGDGDNSNNDSDTVGTVYRDRQHINRNQMTFATLCHTLNYSVGDNEDESNDIDHHHHHRNHIIQSTVSNMTLINEFTRTNYGLWSPEEYAYARAYLDNHAAIFITWFERFGAYDPQWQHYNVLRQSGNTAQSQLVVKGIKFRTSRRLCQFLIHYFGFNCSVHCVPCQFET